MRYACILMMVLSLVACGDDDGGGNNNQTTCTPGAIRPCDCPIGEPGEQTCGVDGAWGTLCAGCADAFCGDGIRHFSEPCDGTDLAGATCSSQGYDGGTLACNPDCTFDVSGCGADLCGNGQIDPSEACDGTDLGGYSCQAMGYDSGELACTGDCTWDLAGCVSDPVDCATATTALADEIYAELGRSCTATVRLHYTTRMVLGFAITCGAYAAVNEATARATAEADTGYGDPAALLGGPVPEDAWVFYQAPGDLGGASAVSSHTGLTVFGGSIVWDGAGDLVYPTAWRPGSELGSGCTPTNPPSLARGFDLALEGAVLASADVDAALGVIARTALPAAFWQGGYLFDAVVLLYPRTVGAFDPVTAEWIVILSGGWLE
jgi:hypothetical protein